MKLSEIRSLLAERGIRLTKSLGQNFLHDANQLRRIVAAAELTPKDKVLEIGPGLGALTESLIQQAGHVLAIEKDARLVEVLQERFRPGSEGRVSTATNPPSGNAKGNGFAQPVPPRFVLVQDDALEFLRRAPGHWGDWKLVANLPYSVASAILVELALRPDRPERMVVTLQLEVARRLAARPGDADYGLLTLLVGLDYELHDMFKIPAGCFFPKPDVDSACVTLLRRTKPFLAELRHPVFVKIVRRAFSQRRKMMFNLLKQDWPGEKLTRAFRLLQLSPQVRAENTSLEQFVKLTQILCRQPVLR